MPRRRVVAKREILPDPKYHNQTVAKFINHVMVSGKKAVAERIVYGALSRIEERGNPDPVEIFTKALDAVAPYVEVKSRRVGGATYQVPREVQKRRSQSLGIRWLVDAARAKRGKPMSRRLAEEIFDAFNSQGVAVTKKDNVHKMAEANSAYSHFAW